MTSTIRQNIKSIKGRNNNLLFFTYIDIEITESSCNDLRSTKRTLLRECGHVKRIGGNCMTSKIAFYRIHTWRTWIKREKVRWPHCIFQKTTWRKPVPCDWAFWLIPLSDVENTSSENRNNIFLHWCIQKQIALHHDIFQDKRSPYFPTMKIKHSTRLKGLLCAFPASTNIRSVTSSLVGSWMSLKTLHADFNIQSNYTKHSLLIYALRVKFDL